MTHSESYSFYSQAVMAQVNKPVDPVEERWLKEMIDAAWLSDLDTEDCVDMILRGQRK